MVSWRRHGGEPFTIPRLQRSDAYSGIGARQPDYRTHARRRICIDHGASQRRIFCLIGSEWGGPICYMRRSSLFFSAPLHALALPRNRFEADLPATSEPEAPVRVLPPQGLPFILVASAFAAYAFIPSGLSAHLLAIFARSGIDAGTVVWIGALFGPAPGRRSSDRVCIRPQRASAVGRAICTWHFVVCIRDAHTAPRVDHDSCGVCAHVWWCQRPRYHHARRRSASVVRRFRLRAAHGQARRSVPADAVGGTADHGVCDRTRVRRSGVGPRGSLRSSCADLFCLAAPSRLRRTSRRYLAG